MTDKSQKPINQQDGQNSNITSKDNQLRPPPPPINPLESSNDDQSSDSNNYVNPLPNSFQNQNTHIPQSFAVKSNGNLNTVSQSSSQYHTVPQNLYPPVANNTQINTHILESLLNSMNQMMTYMMMNGMIDMTRQFQSMPSTPPTNSQFVDRNYSSSLPFPNIQPQLNSHNQQPQQPNFFNQSNNSGGIPLQNGFINYNSVPNQTNNQPTYSNNNNNINNNNVNFPFNTLNQVHEALSNYHSSGGDNNYKNEFFQNQYGNGFINNQLQNAGYPENIQNDYISNNNNQKISANNNQVYDAESNFNVFGQPSQNQNLNTNNNYNNNDKKRTSQKGKNTRDQQGEDPLKGRNNKFLENLQRNTKDCFKPENQIDQEEDHRQNVLNFSNFGMERLGQRFVSLQRELEQCSKIEMKNSTTPQKFMENQDTKHRQIIRESLQVMNLAQQMETNFTDRGTNGRGLSGGGYDNQFINNGGFFSDEKELFTTLPNQQFLSFDQTNPRTTGWRGEGREERSNSRDKHNQSQLSSGQNEKFFDSLQKDPFVDPGKSNHLLRDLNNSFDEKPIQTSGQTFFDLMEEKLKENQTGKGLKLGNISQVQSQIGNEKLQKIIEKDLMEPKGVDKEEINQEIEQVTPATSAKDEEMKEKQIIPQKEFLKKGTGKMEKFTKMLQRNKIDLASSQSPRTSTNQQHGPKNPNSDKFSNPSSTKNNNAIGERQKTYQDDNDQINSAIDHVNPLTERNGKSQTNTRIVDANIQIDPDLNEIQKSKQNIKNSKQVVEDQQVNNGDQHKYFFQQYSGGVSSSIQSNNNGIRNSQIKKSNDTDTAKSHKNSTKSNKNHNDNNQSTQNDDTKDLVELKEELEKKNLLFIQKNQQYEDLKKRFDVVNLENEKLRIQVQELIIYKEKWILSQNTEQGPTESKIKGRTEGSKISVGNYLESNQKQRPNVNEPKQQDEIPTNQIHRSTQQLETTRSETEEQTEDSKVKFDLSEKNKEKKQPLTNVADNLEKTSEFEEEQKLTQTQAKTMETQSCLDLIIGSDQNQKISEEKILSVFRKTQDNKGFSFDSFYRYRGFISFMSSKPTPQQIVKERSGKIIRQYENQMIEEELQITELKNFIFPDCYEIIKYNNGDIHQIIGSEAEIYYYSQDKTSHITLNNEIQIFLFDSNQLELVFANGTKEIKYPDSEELTLLEESSFQLKIKNNSVLEPIEEQPRNSLMRESQKPIRKVINKANQSVSKVQILKFNKTNKLENL